jgi:hypothetical protein
VLKLGLGRALSWESVRDRVSNIAASHILTAIG